MRFPLIGFCGKKRKNLLPLWLVHLECASLSQRKDWLKFFKELITSGVGLGFRTLIQSVSMVCGCERARQLKPFLP